jgi:hypothetical protein
MYFDRVKHDKRSIEDADSAETRTRAAGRLATG